MLIYEFTWNYFCDWYVELAKETLYKEGNSVEKKTTQYVIWFVLEHILRLLHPFMPFITEEIWQKIPHQGLSISMGEWPSYQKESIERNIEEKVSTIQEVIRIGRSIKAEMNIPLTRKVDLHIRVVDNKKENILKGNLPYIKNLAHANLILLGNTIEKPEYSVTGVLEDMEIFVPLQNVIDVEAEVKRLEQKLARIEKELTLINKKLNNTDFIEKAPREVINKEKEKLEELVDIRDRISGNLKTIK